MSSHVLFFINDLYFSSAITFHFLAFSFFKAYVKEMGSSMANTHA